MSVHFSTSAAELLTEYSSASNYCCENLEVVVARLIASLLVSPNKKRMH